MPQALNVLVVMSDQQSWQTLGCTGNPAARTPRLDELAEQATSYDACYTPFPLCCPSRASLWTGLMPRHHHVLGNWRAIAPALRDAGLATAFRDAGYHTIYNGKWHVPGTTPARMGFADTRAIPAVIEGRDRGRVIEEYDDHLRAHGYQRAPGDLQNLTAADIATVRDPRSPHRGRSAIPLEHFLEPWQTDRFLDQLANRPTDRPWLAVCSYNAPHPPLVTPAPYDELIDRARIELPASLSTGSSTKPAQVADSPFASDFADLDEAGWRDAIAHYLGLCSLVDTQVGRILDHLRSVGELDRTIVVYTSDHGDMMGAHGLVAKGHVLHYEEAQRVPLLLRHPDAGPARSDGLVSMIDVGPTLTELAGVAWPAEIDGRSFASTVGDSSGPPFREHVVAETFTVDGHQHGHGEYVPATDWDASRDEMNLSIRTPNLRYIYRSADRDELYDLSRDPGESRDLAGEPDRAADRTRLRATLAAEIRDVFPGVSDELCGVPR